jgi:imidazolonepropionase-like amidohydrolase
MKSTLLLLMVAGAFAPSLRAQPQPVPAATLFRDVRVFDGKTATLSPPSNVLVRANKIEKISTQGIASTDAEVIDGGGRTLMPGLIDAHWHATLVRPSPPAALSDDFGYTMLVAGDEAKDTLMRGFTTVRDLGGPTFGLKRAIDEGIIAGPRIYPSGAMITITGGHGDFRQTFEVPRVIGVPSARSERLGASMIADGADEVLVRVREQLMLGATQIKLTAGGGVASPHTPLDVATFTEPELRAAVEAAANWGTYVTVHAYTPATIRRAVDAGVKCIEHGQLMDEATAKLLADRGVWLSIQPFVADPDETSPFPAGSFEQEKKEEVFRGTDAAYRLAKKYKLKTAFGTDVLFSPQQAKRQGAMLARLARWYSPAELLTMATATNGELLALSGPRNPYPGKLGVVAEGALADLLVVEGDPLKDVGLLANPEQKFVVIMKDGKVYKNTLAKGGGANVSH